MILTPLNVPLKELMVTSSTSPRLKKKKGRAYVFNFKFLFTD